MTTLHEAYKGSSVLITGGLGFIGSNLARALAALEGTKVSIVDSLVPDQGGNLFNLNGIEDRVELHIGDLRDEELLSRLVSGVDYIFNLAGNVSHLDSMRFPLHDLESNCSAQLALLETCRKYNSLVKVVFTSTRQVYGKAQYLPVDEEHPVAPLDINGINKLTAEHYHLLYHRIYGIRSTCVRLTNVYGPRQLLRHDRQGFIPWFIRQALEGNVIELFGDGQQRRDLTYVADVVEALMLVSSYEEAFGEIYNLGGDEEITVSDLAALLIELTGHGSVRTVPFPDERQLIEIGDFHSTHAKFTDLTGWEPRTSLRVGLAQTIDYYREHGEHYFDSNGDPFPRLIQATERI